MTQALEATAAIWLHNAYKFCEAEEFEQILPLHLYKSIFQDEEFFGDFWKEHPKLQAEFIEAIDKKLADLFCGLDEDENPYLSEELAEIISFAQTMHHPSSGPVTSELLFIALLNKSPLFTAKPAKLLQNLAIDKIHALVDRKQEVELTKSLFDSDFFINFNPIEAKQKATVTIGKSKEPSLHEIFTMHAATLDQCLGRSIYGQDHAISTIHETLIIAAAGFERENKTAGSFLFRGPTGSGKTELAREIARELGIPLLKYDMSEYMERHAVSKLIGSPPGYVGNGEGGRLVKNVNANPVSVVLLDEIEKAHPDLFNILLQVMDDGQLTDGRGVKADFSNVILIMTSNIGAREASKQQAGFGTTSENSQEKADDVMKDLFTPEFRNRLDGDIVFNDVKHTVMPQIVSKFITEFQDELETKNLMGEFSSAAMDHLIDKGRKSEFGARDVKRIIERYIKSRVALPLLKGELNEGGHIYVDLDDKGELSIQINPELTPISLPALPPSLTQG